MSCGREQTYRCGGGLALDALAVKEEADRGPVHGLLVAISYKDLVLGSARERQHERAKDEGEGEGALKEKKP